MKTQQTRIRVACWSYVIGAAVLLLAGTAGAYPTWDDCAGCHGGDFRGDDYVSNVDGSQWNDDLMGGHISFIDGDSCAACHFDGFSPVFLNQSDGPVRNQGCVGCHGRDEDVTANDGAFGGPTPGRGDGLRAHHADAGINSCAGCHSADAVQVGEEVEPFNYRPDGGNVLALTDSCDDAVFGLFGLDNDGDGSPDASDSDCVPSVDSDSDGVADDTDNCTNVMNADQTDTDGDGHGNICDADFNQTCGAVNAGDLAGMRAAIFTVSPLHDLNASGGTVNFGDLSLMQGLFFLPPGPSAPGALCN